ncbi:MAG: PAS domain-containing protein [Deltaproteobacteria bacterium]|nr:PAS domain-containing protein [Deltaproteobacteria bacterium]
MERVRQALDDVAAAAAAFSEATSDYEVLLATIARSGSRTLGALCGVSLVDPAAEEVRPVATHDDDPGVAARMASVLRSASLQTSLSGSVEQDLFDPAFDAARYTRLAPDVRATYAAIGVHGFLIVAMRVRGERLGFLWAGRWRRDLPPFDEGDLEMARHLANLAGLAISNSRLLRSAKAAEDRLFLDAIVENIPDMVFVKEAEGLSFVRLNRAGEALLGVPRDQLLGKSDFDFFPREEAEFFVGKDRETLRGKKLVDITEEPIQTSHGPRWLHTKKVPILDADGEPRFLLGISEDITDRKRDIAALRAAVERAEAASAELEAFSHSVAHDLRTPLRAIDGFTRVLVEDCGPQLGEDGRGYCARIVASTQRMAQLIDDLLDLAYVSRSQVRRARIDLAALFRQALDELRRLDPQRSVEVVAAGPLEVDADPKLLAIVFDNLCGNAWKFTSKRTAARIELGAQHVGDELVISVSDNGVGFDMAHADKLFGTFQRLHTEAEFPGTGVGLATVQRIIRHHGGRVWAEGAVDRGAAVHFTLAAP